MESAYNTLRTASGVELLLQRDVDLVARFAREERVADSLRDSAAAVRVAVGRYRQGRHQEIGRIVIARARVALTTPGRTWIVEYPRERKRKI